MKLIYPAHSKRNFYFRQHISKFVLDKKCVPLNPFMIFDYFLLDTVPRNIVYKANSKLVEIADELWVFGEISDGVQAEITQARKIKKPIKFFTILNSREIIQIKEREAELEK